jgi:hypothetical protein
MSRKDRNAEIKRETEMRREIWSKEENDEAKEGFRSWVVVR